MHGLGPLLVALWAACAVVRSQHGEAAGTAAAAAAKKPNFVVLLADDMGYADLGCFGRANISTPNIDSLAHDGLKFTQWISAAPICTPSRAALQTGRLAVRYGMSANVLPFRVFAFTSQPGGLPNDEITVAQALKAAGYATGMSGKWHLGISEVDSKFRHLPKHHGYDSWLGLPYTNMHFCQEGKEDKGFCMLMANDTVIQQPTRMQNLTIELTTHAVDFLELHRNDPFFFLMSYAHVHSPMFSSPQFVNVSAGGRFGDNAEEMDWSVGQILKTLADLGLDNNTLVLFASDNGPFAEEGWENCGRTGGLAGSKGQTYEGGIRVPGIARWPGRIAAGQVTDTMVSTIDIFPTLLGLANVTAPADRIIDGRDMTPVLLSPATAASPHEVFWHYCGHNVTAARYKGYKLHFATPIWTSDARPTPKCVECCPYNIFSLNGTGGSLCDCDKNNLVFHDPPLVYHMATDREERHPLNATALPALPEIVAATRAALAAHYATVGPSKEQMTTPPLPWLMPCCNGVNPLASCECDDYVPHRSYP